MVPDLEHRATRPDEKPENRANPADLPALRRPNGRFAAGGASANPGGRPKAVGTVRDLARAHTQEAIETLVSIMRDFDAPAGARGAAASTLLDRGWGRVPQAALAPNDGHGPDAKALAADFRSIVRQVALESAKMQKLIETSVTDVDGE